MTIEKDQLLCAACGKPIVRARLFYGHVERQPVGTVHYARPRNVRTTREAGLGSPPGSRPASPAVRVPAAGVVPSRNRTAD